MPESNIPKNDILYYANDILSDSMHLNVLPKYIHYLSAEQVLSHYTVRNYLNDLVGWREQSIKNSFFYFLKSNRIWSILEVDRQTIRDYFSCLKKENATNANLARKRSAIYSLFSFLLSEKIIEKSPLNISRKRGQRTDFPIKLDKHLPEYLTQQEINQILEAPIVSKPEGKRDKALLELLYASGLRLGELVDLNLGQVDIERREIRVIKGKEGKDRYSLIGIPAANALNDYLKNARIKLLGSNQTDALFVTRLGKPITERRVQKILDRLARKAGISKNVHPHMVRHTFATHMLDGGADLRVVQELLGHADLSSTQVYTHVTKQQARKVYLATHPLAQEKV